MAQFRICNESLRLKDGVHFSHAPGSPASFDPMVLELASVVCYFVDASLQCYRFITSSWMYLFAYFIKSFKRAFYTSFSSIDTKLLAISCWQVSLPEEMLGMNESNYDDTPLKITCFRSFGIKSSERSVPEAIPWSIRKYHHVCYISRRQGNVMSAIHDRHTPVPQSLFFASSLAVSGVWPQQSV